MMRLLALDVGEVRVGVAASDPTGTLASPRMVLQRRPEKALFKAIRDLVGEEHPEAIIVGYPRSLDGAPRAQAQAVAVFAEQLRRRVPCPVILWDERLSTVAAERELIAAGATRARRRDRLDAVAATIILQNYLDYRRIQNQYTHDHPDEVLKEEEERSRE
jgi:putative Holliday junction resolvase